jgi:GTPase SAR1 family protein/gas vesicle protein
MTSALRKAKEETLDSLKMVMRLLEDLAVPLEEENRSDRLDRIRARYQEVCDGQYRIVVVGAFNVGKTMLINAILGGEYLPARGVECTRQITQVCHAASPHIDITLKDSPDGSFMKALRTACTQLDVRVMEPKLRNNAYVVSLEPNRPEPESFRKLAAIFLDAMWGSASDSEARDLRTNLDELLEIVTLALPMPEWAEDILLIDTPGVNSISETHSAITYNIIPKSHLVLMMINSTTAGNQNDHEFIKLVGDSQNRKMFFIINKRDQIPSSDLSDAKKALIKILPKKLSNPEIFAISGLYGLRAKQLAHGRITWEDIEGEHATRSAIFELAQSPADEKNELYRQVLAKASMLDALTERINDYLRRENKEGAILEKGWQTIRDETHALALLLEQEIEVACNPDALENLKTNALKVEKELRSLESRANVARARFLARAQGGAFTDDGSTTNYPGFESIINDHFNVTNCNQVVGAIHDWLIESGNLEKVKKNSRVLEHQLDSKLQTMFAKGQKALEREVERAESELQAELQSIVQDSLGSFLGEYHRSINGEYSADATAVYLISSGITVAGAAATGAAIGGWLTAWSGPGALMGAGIGAAVGALAGGIYGYFTSDEERIKQLIKTVDQNVMTYILNGGQIIKMDPKTRKEFSETVISVKNQMIGQARAIAEAIDETYRRELKKQFGNLEKARARLIQDGEKLQLRGEKVRTELQPKANALRALHQIAITKLKSL